MRIKFQSILSLFFSITLFVPTFAFSNELIFDLKFDKGKIYTIVEGGAIRGETHSYKFYAKPNQPISIATTSYENNAVFALYYRKNAKWILIEGSKEMRVWYGQLPESASNLYKITVGGTRGNASYELFVGIPVVNASG